MKPSEAQDLFWVYFNVADEIYPELSGYHGRKNKATDITLKDIDPKWVQQARKATEHFPLPWPPYLPAAEEYWLDHPELYQNNWRDRGR